MEGGGVDPELYYDAGWDRVEDDHSMSEWHVGLDDERSDDHPGRHRNGRFARDRAKDLVSDAVLNAGVPEVPARSGRARDTGSTPDGQGRRVLDTSTATRLRVNLNKEAKHRAVSKAELWAERQRRLAAGEAIAAITQFPPTSAGAALPAAPPTSGPVPSTANGLSGDVETQLRTNLNVEAKRRKISKALVWSERVRRYRQGESIAAIVSQPKVAKRSKPSSGAAKRSKASSNGQSRRSITIQGHPIYRSPSRPLPRCPSCGAPEVSCRC